MRTLILRLGIILCSAALLGSKPLEARTIAPYLSVDWDQAVTLPPNDYRAIKPIVIEGDFTVATQPGTVTEGVSFQGRKGTQHWDINGTLMRKTRLGGQLGVSAHGVDSVFEDCEFNKDSPWYVAWWGTHWNFENCIFSKRFVLNRLFPGDYAFHQTRCTFYHIKFPGIEFKDDPAAYLQKENLGFERCHFVDCYVPESILAATVNCVFDHCRFSPKGQTKWPKTMGPVKVTAYYQGPDNEIKSFTDGPLTVDFSSALSTATERRGYNMA